MFPVIYQCPMNRNVVCLSFLIFLLLFSGFCFAQKESKKWVSEANTLIGKPMPDFEGISLNNISWNNEKLKGKVVLLNFWGIMCVPCMVEIPHLNNLQQHYENTDFVLLSIAPYNKDILNELISSDEKSPLSGIKKFFKIDTIAYEIIPACERKGDVIPYKVVNGDTTISIKRECDNILKDFKVLAFPTAFIIDKKGVVRFVQEGFGFSLDMLNNTNEQDTGKLSESEVKQAIGEGIQDGSIYSEDNSLEEYILLIDELLKE
jgi:thiol-disulfide isomerase/thioredoxin